MHTDHLSLQIDAHWLQMPVQSTRGRTAGGSRRSSLDQRRPPAAATTAAEPAAPQTSKVGPFSSESMLFERSPRHHIGGVRNVRQAASLVVCPAPRLTCAVHV